MNTKLESLVFHTISVLCLASLVGCGGDSEPAPEIQKLSFASPSEAETLKNYTNADWLYETYFGAYSLPKESKELLLPSMKLLANGFMLQHKMGRDVNSNIQLVHSTFLQYSKSPSGTQLASSLQSIQPQVAKEAVQARGNKSTPSKESLELWPLNAEDRKGIDAARARDLYEAEVIKKAVKKLRLPYTLDGQTEQWFIYSPGMKGGKGVPEDTPLSQSHGDITTWGWRPGDVTWVNGTSPISGVPGHNSIAYGRGREVYMVDANPGVGVRLHRDVQSWANQYTEVRALTPNLAWNPNWYSTGCYYCNEFSESQARENIYSYAQNRVGYPYNWAFFNWNDTDSFYCSSLLYHAYDSVGRRTHLLPYNHSGILYPSAIRSSTALFTFKVSVTRAEKQWEEFDQLLSSFSDGI